MSRTTLDRVVHDGTLMPMDTISSAEFRKRYASLRVPTIVTVNGHTIGTWMPSGSSGTPLGQDADVAGGRVNGGNQSKGTGLRSTAIPESAGFGTSKPAPKPGKGKA